MKLLCTRDMTVSIEKNFTPILLVVHVSFIFAFLRPVCSFWFFYRLSGLLSHP